MLKNYPLINSVLSKWYIFNKRELPWRDTKDPYLIWISEIILQQTRVVQGYDYYLRFEKAFPDIATLASADEDEVLKLWQGLGYYSRARNLHTAAKTIASEHNGLFPDKYMDIRKLKGVGDYTAAAIASFAFGLAHAVVDGNVYRVLSRLFAIDAPIDSTPGKKLFAELAEQLLNKDDPGLHNQAVMEFGALQCVPVSPNCAACPLGDICKAYAENKVSGYPVKQGKTKVKERFFNYLDIRFGSSMYLKKRTSNDIWKNLYELPLIETDCKMSFEELQQTDAFRSIFSESSKISIRSSKISLKHILSHRIIYADFYRIEVDTNSLLNNLFLEIDVENLDSFAISRLVDKYFEISTKSDLFSGL